MKCRINPIDFEGIYLETVRVPTYIPPEFPESGSNISNWYDIEYKGYSFKNIPGIALIFRDEEYQIFHKESMEIIANYDIYPLIDMVLESVIKTLSSYDWRINIQSIRKSKKHQDALKNLEQMLKAEWDKEKDKMRKQRAKKQDILASPHHYGGPGGRRENPDIIPYEDIL